MTIPTIETPRLLMRPFTADDAPAVQSLAGHREVASTTLTIPHPYDDGVAEVWIEGHARQWEERKNLALAMTTESDGLVGTMSLALSMPHRRAELGYWVGVPYWGRGFATEAAAAMVAFGFDDLGLNRIEAMYLTRNPAS